ncbi:hypothetical protein PENPOL_c005G04419 [Penicillium polonicum]|uniref:Uncharacterized protein n=1 Tax=Penicillium polonicum TaxID=60169 RepID=A0A1V6NN95_PENPO|nr:hypothetical protein PENPOL_c005G04419 [Penicillium polonicum]
MQFHQQHHLHGRPAEHAAGTLASPWEIATLYDLPGAGNMAQKLPSACSAGRPCHLQQHASSWERGTVYDLPGAGAMEYKPAPGTFSDYMISQGLATWHRNCHLRVQRADQNNTICMMGPLNTQQEHKPAPGTFSDYMISQGLATWHRSCHLRVQQADHATFSNSQLLGAGNII